MIHCQHDMSSHLREWWFFLGRTAVLTDGSYGLAGFFLISTPTSMWEMMHLGALSNYVFTYVYICFKF
ncbi:hypothetical protein B0T14DRAFT_268681 [Immersiella caudata]|uniref:Uncharacterized protein n=1 Tax=Immersiella caudata TaxID=314043 RepID=A0AA39WL66_9PEZI|nr:hypothetical protein B0T14DRAFT_268681 [Immersiella caudata]